MCNAIVVSLLGTVPFDVPATGAGRTGPEPSRPTDGVPAPPWPQSRGFLRRWDRGVGPLLLLVQADDVEAGRAVPDEATAAEPVAAAGGDHGHVLARHLVELLELAEVLRQPVRGQVGRGGERQAAHAEADALAAGDG